MSSALKAATFEKQALSKAIVSGIRGGVGGWDKHVYRPILNLTRPSGSRISSSQWSRTGPGGTNYRDINPAYGYRMAGLGALGYGGYQGYQGVKEGLGPWAEGIGKWWDQANFVPQWARDAWSNKGLIAGTALPVLAFIASRGKIKPKATGTGAAQFEKTRNIWPTVAAAGAFGYGGSQLDDWNREDAMIDRQADRELKEKIINRYRFYDGEGVSRNSDDGSLRPSMDADYWKKQLGRVTTTPGPNVYLD